MKDGPTSAGRRALPPPRTRSCEIIGMATPAPRNRCARLGECRPGEAVADPPPPVTNGGSRRDTHRGKQRCLVRVSCQIDSDATTAAPFSASLLMLVLSGATATRLRPTWTTSQPTEPHVEGRCASDLGRRREQAIASARSGRQRRIHGAKRRRCRPHTPAATSWPGQGSAGPAPRRNRCECPRTHTHNASRRRPRLEGNSQQGEGLTHRARRRQPPPAAARSPSGASPRTTTPPRSAPEFSSERPSWHGRSNCVSFPQTGSFRHRFRSFSNDGVRPIRRRPPAHHHEARYERHPTRSTVGPR